ncbi:hypothetical protein MKW92_045840 [Papaver armeniacum]|nr:hypothetical protein MKW92_045840 [Papaver armeniacum]
MYAGKRMAYIYKAKAETNESRHSCTWGKCSNSNNGVVRAKITSNLPHKSMVREKQTSI